MSAQWPTYKPLALEFLSTLMIDEKMKTMTFNLGNVWRHLSTNEFNEKILHVPLRGFATFPKRVHHKDTWSKLVISDEPYVSNTSKASSIWNRVFRYIQRVMAHNLFGRDNNTGITVK